MKITPFFCFFLSVFSLVFGETLPTDISSDSTLKLDDFYQSAAFIFDFSENKISGDFVLQNDKIHYKVTFKGSWTPFQMIHALQGKTNLADEYEDAFDFSNQSKIMHVEFFSENLGILAMEDAEFSPEGQKLWHQVINQEKERYSEEISYYTYTPDGELAEVRKVNVITGEEKSTLPIDSLDERIPSRGILALIDIGENFPLTMTFIFEEEEPFVINFYDIQKQGKDWREELEELFSRYDFSVDLSGKLFPTNPEDLIPCHECGRIKNAIRKIVNDLAELAIAFIETTKDNVIYLLGD